MDILVTGGLGYIGSHTCVQLLNKGHNVIILDNLSNCSFRTLNALEKISDRKPIFYKGDIRDRLILNRIFDHHRVDTVMHFAGYKSVPESVDRPLEYYENNVCGTLTLLESMQAAGVMNIIFSSSASVYGSPKSAPISEFHKLAPTNPYANTKKQIEEILRDLTRSNPDWKVNILRYFNPAGAHHSGEIGESPVGTPGNLVPYIIRVIGGKIPFLSIYGDAYPTEDGTGVRDFIHVVDVADGHLASMNFMKDTTEGFSVFNLGRGEGVSVLQMVDKFKTISGINFKTEILGPRAGDVAECYADVSKAKSILGWNATRSLDEMCSSALFHFDRNR